MRPIATDGVAWSLVCLCVGLSVGYYHEPYKKRLNGSRFIWEVTPVGPRNHVLDGVHCPVEPKREETIVGACSAH